MGQLMGFYAGDADAIGAAYEDSESDGLADENVVRAHADFSLHLTPVDVDFLVEAIAEGSGKTARPLLESLIRLVGGEDETGSSADVVDPAWVQLVAGANEARAPDLAAEWIKRVGAEYGETLEVSPEAVQAVGELIQLCRLAASESLDVVFTWSL
jgi:hypothetical protein